MFGAITITGLTGVGLCALTLLAVAGSGLAVEPDASPGGKPYINSVGMELVRIEAGRVVGARAVPIESEAATRFWSSQ